MSDGPAYMLLGVDTGGTNSRARLTNADGTVLGEGRAGPGNAYADSQGSWCNIQEAISAAFSAGGLAAHDRTVTRACFGIAGLDPDSRRVPSSWTFGDFASYRVETDAHIALQGAHRGKDGAVVIVGTGTVGLAQKDGRRLSVGGYGPSLSDEGGGAWIGREAVRRMLWSFDGRIPSSKLTARISEALGPPAAVLKWAQQAKAVDFGAFAPLVVRTAEEGDENAVRILADAAVFINGIIARLSQVGIDRISVLGGLAEALSPKLDFMGIEHRRPLGDALSGAVLLAAA